MHLDITTRDYKTLKYLLNAYLPGTTVWAFGSRVKFTSKPESDLDLVAFIEPEQESSLAELKDAFAESDLLFKVDILDWSVIPDNFKRNIEKDYVVVHDENIEESFASSNWKKYKLGDIAEIVGGATPSTNIKEYWNGRIPWLTPRDLTNYKFRYISKGDRSISEIGLKNSSAKLIPENSILLTSRAPIGYLAIASNQLCTNQGFKSFVVNKDKCDNIFLYYLLKNNIDNLKALGTGTTFLELSAATLRNIEFNFPDLPVQSQLAFILSSLDDKIELNQQMNQTLESIAQTIFKEWYCLDVDDIPKGWSLKKLSEVADVASSKRIFMEEYVKNGVPFYRGKEVTQLSNGERINTELFISEARYNDIKSKSGVPIVGDILITSVGTIGSTWLVDNNSPFYFKDGNVTWMKDYKIDTTGEFIYQWLQTKQAQKQINSITIGSTQQALTISALKGLNIVIPDSETVSKITTQLKIIYSKRINNLNQIKTLIEIRERLLPRLMTGKIKVKA